MATGHKSFPQELPQSPPPKTKGRLSSGLSRLRGKDSNLDYLIQSQASYH
jgi:hypothetical protein